jgi:hypothetical protein
MTVFNVILSWVYFFTLKRMKWLRVSKAVEVLGRDTIMNAESKGLELDLVVEKIEQLYPQPKKKGC